MASDSMEESGKMVVEMEENGGDGGKGEVGG